MGLFDKLFDKKECVICGKELGLLGKRKLEDGHMCKQCAEKLSPFITDRRGSTAEEIRQHLAYREDNLARVPNFHPSRSFGFGSSKLHFDGQQNCFILTSGSNWRSGNPDIVAIQQVTSCDIDVSEHRRELYQTDAEGRRESYSPPRYELSYSFHIRLHIDSPYFDEMYFELSGSDRPNSRDCKEYFDLMFEAQTLQATLMPQVYSMPEPPKVDAGQALGDLFRAAAAAVGDAARNAPRPSKAPAPTPRPAEEERLSPRPRSGEDRFAPKSSGRPAPRPGEGPKAPKPREL